MGSGEAPAVGSQKYLLFSLLKYLVRFSLATCWLLLVWGVFITLLEAFPLLGWRVGRDKLPQARSRRRGGGR